MPHALRRSARLNDSSTAWPRADESSAPRISQRLRPKRERNDFCRRTIVLPSGVATTQVALGKLTLDCCMIVMAGLPASKIVTLVAGMSMTIIAAKAK